MKVRLGFLEKKLFYLFHQLEGIILFKPQSHIETKFIGFKSMIFVDFDPLCFLFLKPPSHLVKHRENA